LQPACRRQAQRKDKGDGGTGVYKDAPAIAAP